MASSSVTCVAFASVSPSAEGHLCRVIVRNGENVYGKEIKGRLWFLPDPQEMVASTTFHIIFYRHFC